jgi:hypothetical protein
VKHRSSVNVHSTTERVVRGFESCQRIQVFDTIRWVSNALREKRFVVVLTCLTGQTIGVYLWLGDPKL